MRGSLAVINSWSCNVNSCVWSNDDFIFRQRITLMRTFIILLITSIDSFTCLEIRFCCVFQSIFNSNPDQTWTDEVGLPRTFHPFLWTTDQNFKILLSISWTDSDAGPRLSFLGRRVDGFLMVDRRPQERIRTTDH